MRSALLGLALLVLLTVGPPAHAGSPDMPSGALTLDQVADGPLRYRKEKDVSARITLLQRLALTHDPRVGVALWEARCDPSLEACIAADRAFVREFIGGERGRALERLTDDFEARAREWAALGVDVHGLWRMVFVGCGNG
jgi:hypothetical protein